MHIFCTCFAIRQINYREHAAFFFWQTINDGDLTHLGAPVSYPRHSRVTSLRQWGRHVFLVSSHDDRNGSETRCRIRPSSCFLLYGRSHPWRPTFTRINIRHATYGDARIQTSDLQVTISFTLRLNAILIYIH